MRISDWSSDVCSSDLHDEQNRKNHDHLNAKRQQHNAHISRQTDQQIPSEKRGQIEHETGNGNGRDPDDHADQAHGDLEQPLDRSEEHTSELQSLMRISYAVFCLKKKNNNKT